MEEVNGEELVKRFAEEMEEMLGRKMKSVKVTCLSFQNLNESISLAHSNISCLSLTAEAGRSGGRR